MTGLLTFVSDCQNIDWDKLNKLEIQHEVKGETIFLYLYCILDSGAESNFVDSALIDMLKPILSGE